MSPKARHAKVRRVSQLTRKCWANNPRSDVRISRSTFHQVRVLATSLSSPKVSTKAYGEHLLVEDMTFQLPPGGIVGVIGPNGAGKTRSFE